MSSSSALCWPLRSSFHEFPFGWGQCAFHGRSWWVPGRNGVPTCEPCFTEELAAEEANMRAIHDEQQKGEQAVLDSIAWGRRPWWRRWLRRP